jgi:hypothetical protein
MLQFIFNWLRCKSNAVDLTVGLFIHRAYPVLKHKVKKLNPDPRLHVIEFKTKRGRIIATSDFIYPPEYFPAHGSSVCTQFWALNLVAGYAPLTAGQKAHNAAVLEQHSELQDLQIPRKTVYVEFDAAIVDYEVLMSEPRVLATDSRLRVENFKTSNGVVVATSDFVYVPPVTDVDEYENPYICIANWSCWLVHRMFPTVNIKASNRILTPDQLAHNTAFWLQRPDLCDLIRDNRRGAAVPFLRKPRGSHPKYAFQYYGVVHVR